MDTPAFGNPGSPPSPPPPSKFDQGIASKIVHSKPAIGGPAGAAPGAPTATGSPGSPTSSASTPASEPSAMPVPGTSGGGQKITMFGRERRHEDSWTRTPNTTGAGAIHVKTFHCKLTEDALTYMDQLINEWLDAHPQYEVKFVHSTIGTFTGKLKEPALVCQVWV